MKINLSKNQRFLFGFTLIELLVVIAIMMLLSSIGATAALRTREKGKDIGIIANLSQVRTEATLIKNRTDSYSNLCFGNVLNTTNSNLMVIVGEIKKYNGNQDIDCYTDTNNYCVQSPLATTGFYCIDSTGYAGTLTNTNCGVAGNISCQ